MWFSETIDERNCSQQQALRLKRLSFLFAGYLIFIFAGRLNAQQTTATIDDVFAAVGARVPAFGGMFVDEDRNTLYVYMVPGQAGDLVALGQAISDAFAPQQQQIATAAPASALVSLVPRLWYNPSIESRNFLLPRRLQPALYLGPDPPAGGGAAGRSGWRSTWAPRRWRSPSRRETNTASA